MRITVGEPFKLALCHMIDLWRSRPIPADQIPTVILRSGELTAALPDLKPWFAEVLPDLLSHEPAIDTGGTRTGNGWEREATRSVTKFHGMHTVEEYIEKTIEIVTANAGSSPPRPTPCSSTRPRPSRR